MLLVVDGRTECGPSIHKKIPIFSTGAHNVQNRFLRTFEFKKIQWYLHYVKPLNEIKMVNIFPGFFYEMRFNEVFERRLCTAI